MSTCPSPASSTGREGRGNRGPWDGNVSALAEKLKKEEGVASMDDILATYDTAFILSDASDTGIAQAEQRLAARIDGIAATVHGTPLDNVLVQRVGQLEVTSL